MLTLSVAQALKEAGLVWTPALHDFFAIPDRGLDDRAFVISDMTVYVEQQQGRPVATFHGTEEWALDYVMANELVWLPSESQLREELERRLMGEPQPAVRFHTTADGYVCEIQFQGETLPFEAFGAAEAYAAALIHVLRTLTIE